MPYTMAHFRRDFIRKHFRKLTSEDRLEILRSWPPQERWDALGMFPRRERRKIFLSLPPEERREMLDALPLEERLVGITEEQIRQYLERLTANRPTKPRKPRRKK